MRNGLLLLMLVSGWVAPLDSIDRVVQRAIQNGRRPKLERPVRLVNSLGDRVVVVSLMLGIAVLDPLEGPATVRSVLLAAVPANLLVEAGKLTFNRARPDGGHKRANSSFPSSHAANAFTLAWVLSRRWRRAAPGFLLLAAGVGFARMYLNRHFLSDVVVGSAVGVVCAHMILQWQSTRVRRREREQTGGGG